MQTNIVHTGDNLNVLQTIEDNSIDLIYLDPPFNKKKQFKAPIGTEAEGAAFKDCWKEEDVEDSWILDLQERYPFLCTLCYLAEQIGQASNKYYLFYMAIRLVEMYRVLKPTGSLFLHCDQTMNAYLKIVLDCIFHEDNFKNEVIWCYQTGGASKKYYARKHDTIFWYSKTENYFFDCNKIKIKRTEKSLLRAKNKKGARVFDEFKLPIDVWNIQALNPMSKERTGYPTQKPIALLKRIIQGSTQEEDIVLDPFCGCATTCVAAHELGRQWIGIDVSEKAKELVEKRINCKNSELSTLGC